MTRSFSALALSFGVTVKTGKLFAGGDRVILGRMRRRVSLVLRVPVALGITTTPRRLT